MNAVDLTALALLALVGGVLSGGLVMVVLVRRHLAQLDARLLSQDETEPSVLAAIPESPQFQIVQRPNRWLAVRTRDLQLVQSALGIADGTPWSGEELPDSANLSKKVFITPPINGWTLVFGAALPSPDDDVDVCFHFVRDLSRKLGQVQFFQADHLLQHHAWVRAESGRVQRAYAWAGLTLWNQGIKTAAEIRLGLNCFAYGENPGSDDWAVADHIVANVDRVAELAQAWSVDPARFDLRHLARTPGIAGNRSRHR